MSIKIIFDSKNEVPEHLQSQAEEVDGKFTLDGSGVINKNKELLKDISKLNDKNERLAADKEAADAQVTELKKNSKIPAGQKLVATEIAELGEAVQPLGLSKDELAALKTDNDTFKSLGTLEEIKAKVEGYDTATQTAKQAVKDRALMAAGVTDLTKAKGFKSYDALEVEAETKDGKEIFQLVSKDASGKETRTPFDGESLKTADAFKDNLATLLGAQKTKLFRQGTNTDAANKFDLIREKTKEQNGGMKGATFEDKFHKRGAA